MSTNITRLVTRFENPRGWSPGAASDLSLTAFYGGREHGRCLQLTISARHDTAYIPLTREDAGFLRQLLQDFENGMESEAMAEKYGGDDDIRDKSPA